MFKKSLKDCLESSTCEVRNIYEILLSPSTIHFVPIQWMFKHLLFLQNHSLNWFIYSSQKMKIKFLKLIKHCVRFVARLSILKQITKCSLSLDSPSTPCNLDQNMKNWSKFDVNVLMCVLNMVYTKWKMNGFEHPIIPSSYINIKLKIVVKFSCRKQLEFVDKIKIVNLT